MNNDDYEKFAKVLQDGVLSYLSDTYKKCRCSWEAALKLLDKAESNNLDKTKLEYLEEIKERLFRIYYVTSELFNGYLKITKVDKWEVNFDPFDKFKK